MPSSHNEALNGFGADAPAHRPQASQRPAAHGQSYQGSNRYQRPPVGTTFAAPPSGYPTIATASLPHAPRVAQVSQYTPPSCWAGVKQKPHLRCLVLTVGLLLAVVLKLAGVGGCEATQLEDNDDQLCLVYW